MAFTKGNKLSVGHGRPPGTGKKQNISRAFQEFLARKEGGKLRFENMMRNLYNEDLRTFLAYAFGKPIETHASLDDEGNAATPPAVIAALQETWRTL
jgi:hypothetical protein